MYVPELLEQIIELVFDPDDVDACEHIYSLRLVSRAFLLPIARVTLRSIRIQYDLNATRPRPPSEFSDSRPTFDADKVMSNQSIPPEHRRYVREVFFETNLEASWWGRNGRKLPYDGDQQYLARFFTAFRTTMLSNAPKIRLFICPGSGWKWSCLVKVTEPLSSLPDLEVGWWLDFRFSVRNARSLAFPGSPVPPIHVNTNPDITNSSDVLPPRRIVFADAHDGQEIVDCIVATYPYLRALELRWAFLRAFPPISPKNCVPPHALSKLVVLSWSIQVKDDDSDSDTSSVRSSSPASPGPVSTGFMERVQFVTSRLKALDAFLAQFPKENGLRELSVHLLLDFCYWTDGFAWLDDEVEPVLCTLADTLADRFDLLQLELNIRVLGGADAPHNQSKAEQIFEVLAAIFRQKLVRGCGVNVVWSLSTIVGDLQQDDLSRDLRRQTPGWNLDWLSSGKPSNRGQDLPPRKVVARAFLEGRKPFNPFQALDGWREDIDEWGSGGEWVPGSSQSL
jgi:hypothetical protein